MPPYHRSANTLRAGYFFHNNGLLEQRHLEIRGETLRDKFNILMIETTSRCNARCSYCPSGVSPSTVPQRHLSHGVLQRSIEFAKLGRAKALWLHHSGEPFLHEDLPEIIRVVRRNGFYANLSTNLIAFDENRVADVLKVGLNDMRIHLTAGLTRISIDEMFRRIHVVRRLNWAYRNDGCRIEVTHALVGETAEQAYRRFQYSEYYDDKMYIDFYHPHDWPALMAGRDNGIDPSACKWHVTKSAAVLANGDIVICCLDQLGCSTSVNVMDITKLDWRFLSDRRLCRGCVQFGDMDSWIEEEGLAIPRWLARRQRFDIWM